MKQVFSLKYLFFLGFAWLISWGALKAHAFSSYIVPGHEYLTKFALEELKESEDKLTRVFYGDYVGGVSYLSHPLTYGNVVNDFHRIDLELSKILIKILLGEEWSLLSPEEQEYIMKRVIDHSDNSSQIMHFTRNYLGDNQQESISAKESCLLSHNFIKNTVLYGIEVMAEKRDIAKDLGRYDRKQLGFKFIGAGLHTLQDAFAPAHTKRDPTTLLLKDICSFRTPYFGRNGASLYSVGCVHTIFPSPHDFGGGSILEDDQIWHRGQTNCQIKKDGMIDKSFDCLTDQAQLATVVSKDFLEFLVPFLDQALRKKNVVYQDITTALNSFLNDYHPDQERFSFDQGIMSCESLSDFTPHTRFENY